MKVRALKLGHYDHKRRREGEEFELRPVKGFGFDKDGKKVEKVFSVEDQFSSKWMEKVDDDAEEIVEEKPKKKAKKKLFGGGDDDNGDKSYDDEVI